MSMHRCRDHRAPAFYVLIGMRACLVRDNLPAVVIINVVAAGTGSALAADMETSQ